MRKFIMYLFCLVFMLSLSACKTEQEKSATNTNSAGYKVVDATGETVAFDKPPTKILPITRSLAETVIDLVGPERVLAINDESVADNSFIKEKARKVKNITGKSPSVETIMGYKPDLVVMPNNSDVTKIKVLRSAGLKVLVTTTPYNLPDMKKRVAFVAEALHAEEQGKVLLAKIDEKLAALHKCRETVKDKPRVLLAFSKDGAFGRAGGLLDNFCKESGIKNGAADRGLKRLGHLSKEQVIEVNPDIVLLPKSLSGDNKIAEEIANDPAYQNLKAFKNKNFIYLDERLYNYNISQYAFDAAYLLARGVYPEYLPKVDIWNY